MNRRPHDQPLSIRLICAGAGKSPRRWPRPTCAPGRATTTRRACVSCSTTTPPARLPLGERLKLSALRALLGRDVPAALNHARDNRYPVGAVAPDAYSGRAMMWVLRSGAVEAGRWAANTSGEVPRSTARPRPASNSATRDASTGATRRPPHRLPATMAAVTAPTAQAVVAAR